MNPIAFAQHIPPNRYCQAVWGSRACYFRPIPFAPVSGGPYMYWGIFFLLWLQAIIHYTVVHCIQGSKIGEFTIYLVFILIFFFMVKAVSKLLLFFLTLVFSSPLASPPSNCGRSHHLTGWHQHPWVTCGQKNLMWPAAVNRYCHEWIEVDIPQTNQPPRTHQLEKNKWFGKVVENETILHQ